MSRFLNLEAAVDKDASYGEGTESEESSDEGRLPPCPRSASSSVASRARGKMRARLLSPGSLSESEDEPPASKKKKRKRNNPDSQSNASLLDEKKKTNKLLQSLVKTVKKLDTRLHAVESKMSSSASGSSQASRSTPGSTPNRRKNQRDVPDEVRVRVMYVLRKMACPQAKQGPWGEKTQQLK